MTFFFLTSVENIHISWALICLKYLEIVWEKVCSEITFDVAYLFVLADESFGCPIPTDLNVHVFTDAFQGVSSV